MDTSDKKTPDDEIEELDEIWDDLDDLDDFEDEELIEAEPVEDAPKEAKKKPTKKAKKKKKEKPAKTKAQDSDQAAIPKKSNKTRNIMIGALVILGAGAYSFSPLIMQMLQPPAQNDIPVVQIEEAQDAETDVTPQTADVDETQQSSETAEQQAPALPDFQPLETEQETIQEATQTEEPDPVLTPLPEQVDTAEISLTDLIPQSPQEEAAPSETAEEPEAEQQQAAEEPTSSLNDLIKLEQEMLNKTETPFAEDVVDNVMDDVVDTGSEETEPQDLEADSILSDLLDTPIEDTEETPAIEDVLEIEETPTPVAIEETPAPEPVPQEEAEIKEEPAPPPAESETPAPQENKDTIQASESVEEDFNVMPDKKPAAPEKAVQADPVPETTKAATKKTNTAPQKAAPKWIIRAAQPGNAVIFDLNSKEMKSIEAGSNVRGIGKVKEIGFKDGKWYVQGSSGKIEQ